MNRKNDFEFGWSVACYEENKNLKTLYPHVVASFKIEKNVPILKFPGCRNWNGRQLVYTTQVGAMRTADRIIKNCNSIVAVFAYSLSDRKQECAMSVKNPASGIIESFSLVEDFKAKITMYYGYQFPKKQNKAEG